MKNPKAREKQKRTSHPRSSGISSSSECQIIKFGRSGALNLPPLVVPREVQLKEFREIPPGSVLNRDLLVEALSKIEARYKKIGYIYWFADPTYRDVGDHRVDVDVKLFEGDKFYLGRLEVTGNTTTRDKVVRREFALDEGDVMNMEAVKKSLQKLQQLGYFKVTKGRIAVRGAEKVD